MSVFDAYIDDVNSMHVLHNDVLFSVTMISAVSIMTRKLKLSASPSALELSSIRPALVTLSPLPASPSSPPPPVTLRHDRTALALSLPLVLMSGAHQKDYSENNRDLELPSKPATSSISIPPTQSAHTLPPRPNFALPPRPSTVPCPPRSARPLRSSLRSPSPPRVSWRSRITDTGARISRSRSPSPRRYRSRSPERYRSSKHTKYRSPSPRYQRRSPSPRARSPFAVQRPSIRRSPSSRPRSRSPPREKLREKSKGSLLSRIVGQHPSKTDHHIAYVHFPISSFLAKPDLAFKVHLLRLLNDHYHLPQLTSSPVNSLLYPSPSLLVPEHIKSQLDLEQTVSLSVPNPCRTKA